MNPLSGGAADRRLSHLRHRRTMILKLRVAVPEVFVAVMVTR